MEELAHAMLVEHATRGGAEAARAETEICRRFAPRIRLYGLRHLRNEDRARDLVQAVLMTTLEAVRAGRIEDPSKLDRFVLGTCRNTALRMRERDGKLELMPVEALDRPIEIDVESVDLEALFRCIAALEERPRIVVQLSFQEERSADEIAAKLGTSAANVRVMRHRAVAALRTCIDSKGAA